MIEQQATPKLDLKKQYKHLYLPSAKEVSFVDVPDLLFIMMDGRIEAGVLPGESDSFAQAMNAMYGVAYTLKFMSKLNPLSPLDFTVMAMEGLWSAESGEFAFGKVEPWLYTLLMLQPDHITDEMFAEAVQQARAKRPSPVFDDIRLERWREGPSIQLMHVGPYADEPRSIEMLHSYADVHGFDLHGRHHEVYLGDPRKAKPENLKTVLRHPVRKR